MTCPNCDRTMQNVGAGNRFIFWCPYCGTLKTEHRTMTCGPSPTVQQFEEHEVPKLIREPQWIPAIAELLAKVDALLASLRTGMGVIHERGATSVPFLAQADQTVAALRDLKEAAATVREK